MGQGPQAAPALPGGRAIATWRRGSRARSREAPHGTPRPVTTSCSGLSPVPPEVHGLPRDEICLLTTCREGRGAWPVSGPGSWNYRKPTGPSNLEGVSAASCHFLGDSDSIQCGQSISEAASTLFLSAFFDCMNKTGLRCVCKERGGSGFNVFGNSPQPLQTRVG